MMILMHRSIIFYTLIYLRVLKILVIKKYNMLVLLKFVYGECL